MANEVEVFELDAIRSPGTPLAPMPPIAKQTLSIGGAVSAAFNRSTRMVRITTTTQCRVEFSTKTGTDPAGTGMTMLVYTGQYNDFEVIAGRKVIAVSA